MWIFIYTLAPGPANVRGGLSQDLPIQPTTYINTEIYDYFEL